VPNTPGSPEAIMNLGAGLLFCFRNAQPKVYLDFKSVTQLWNAPTMKEPHFRS
ncbi:hypothetical protein KGM_205912B, partial [Danaus plexippus plexippus]